MISSRLLKNLGISLAVIGVPVFLSGFMVEEGDIRRYLIFYAGGMISLWGLIIYYWAPRLDEEDILGYSKDEKSVGRLLDKIHYQNLIFNPSDKPIKKKDFMLHRDRYMKRLFFNDVKRRYLFVIGLVCCLSASLLVRIVGPVYNRDHLLSLALFLLGIFLIHQSMKE
ncbi:hypothetical protein JW968_06225 [Candidatus Woesearchaeota archaeon]|nr:hypothetical protein [Candidatus Woesearchaeota archaeon]